MTHISHDELNKKINEVSKLVELGAIYKHYKYPDRDYKMMLFPASAQLARSLHLFDTF
jgi:hypothetical protein